MTIHQPLTSRVGDRTTPFDPAREPFRLAAVDLYRDIHKGIRAELFAITSTAGERTSRHDHPSTPHQPGR